MSVLSQVLQFLVAITITVGHLQAHTSEIETACTEYFGEDFTLKEANLTPLEGGLMTKMYSLQWRNREYAVRLLDPNTNTALRRLEVEIAKVAGDHSLGPKVYYHDSDYTKVIREFGEGGTYLRSHPKRRIHELGKIIKKLHTLSFHNVGIPNKMTIWKTMDNRINEMQTAGFSVPQELTNALSHANATRSLLELSEDDTVLCHNDLHCLNILCSGKDIKLIDWALSAPGSRYFDLAHLAVWLAMSEIECDQLLVSYFGRRLDGVEHAQFKLAINLPYLALSVWAFHKLSITYQGPQENLSSAIKNSLNHDSLKWVSDFVMMHGDRKLQELDNIQLLQIATGGLQAYREGAGLSLFLYR